MASPSAAQVRRRVLTTPGKPPGRGTMDSESAVIFKRKSGKSKPSRTRQSSPDPQTTSQSGESGRDNGKHDDADAAESTESPSVLATKLKAKAKKLRVKSKLSFGVGEEDEEEGGEVFKVKKSKLSSKITLGKSSAAAVALPANLDQATITPQRGPTYDSAYLNELKASTPTTRPRLANQYDEDTAMVVDTPGTDDISRPLELYEDDAMQRSSTQILSESSIKVAKERRERLRKAKDAGDEDFISLSLTRRSEDLGPHPTSRLVREDDELGEGDDEYAEFTSAQERIALGKKSRKVEAAKRREGMREMIEEAEDEDEEMMEWEQEQLRRGGHRGSIPSAASKAKEIYRPAPIPIPTAIPTLAPVISRLAQQLSQLTASHAGNTAALNNLALERDQVEEREKEMREMVVKAEDKRAWFNEFKDWIESVASFLDEKYPLLEQLEKDHTALLKERHDLVEQRRQQDDEDDLAAFYGPLPAAPADEEEEVDELGRTIPKPTASDRRAARIHRRRARLGRRKTTAPPQEEGYSTDSSLPPADAQDFDSAISSLQSRAKEVLSDVRAQEFKNPFDMVDRSKWALWREKYGETYRNAWGGLGVVSVWEFWVRLEVVSWDCIEDKRSLDSFKWFTGLYAYSRPNLDDGDDELGPDGDLVAAMISTALIPRICVELESGAFDVYNEGHVKRAVDLAEEVEASIEQSNTVKFQNLLGAVVSRFQKAVEDTDTLLDKFISNANAGRAAGFNPDSVPSRRRFLNRRAKLLRNMVRWRKFTGERFGLDRLVVRLIEDVILRVAENGWEVGGQEVFRDAVALLPKELVTAKLRMRLEM